MRPASTISRKLLSIVPLAIVFVHEGRAQSPGIVMPGPNDAATYRDVTNRLIDRAKGALLQLPEKAIPSGRETLPRIAKSLKSLNDARAKAEAYSNNPQNAGVTRPLSDSAARAPAEIAPKDREYRCDLRRRLAATRQRSSVMARPQETQPSSAESARPIHLCPVGGAMWVCSWCNAWGSRGRP